MEGKAKNRQESAAELKEHCMATTCRFLKEPPPRRDFQYTHKIRKLPNYMLKKYTSSRGGMIWFRMSLQMILQNKIKKNKKLYPLDLP